MKAIITSTLFCIFLAPLFPSFSQNITTVEKNRLVEKLEVSPILWQKNG
jgi:hypothetical protein